MTQTLTGRIADLLASLVSPAGRTDSAAHALSTTEVPPERADEAERLPERDEGFYWAMHAHW